MTKPTTIITPHLSTGGVATASLSYYKMLKNQNIKTHLILLVDAPILEEYNIPKSDITIIGMKDGISVLKLLHNIILTPKLLLLLFNIKNSNTVFVHFTAIFFGALYCKLKPRNNNNNNIFSLHTNIYSYKKNTSKLKRFIFNILEKQLKTADHITFLTEDVEKEYVKKHPSNKNTHTIYNAISSKKNGTKKDTGGILFAGRLSKEKNIDFIINSYAKYRNTGGSENLIIAGEGPEENSLKLLVEKSIYKNDIIFTGHVNNISTVMHSAKILVLASEIEGFPLILIEAINQNTVTISSNCSSGPSYILASTSKQSVDEKYHGELETPSGYLLPVPSDKRHRDLESKYAEYFHKAISKGPLTDQVRDRTLKAFDINTITAQWLGILK